jgi:NAD(P)-dependent dehydrogenase (short-subunit alcohol dehydrogenase family)
MELDGTHILVAGATGALGGALARALDEAGAELALAGRDAARLDAIGDELGVPTARFDVTDPEGRRTAVDSLAAALGGELDGVVVAVGAPGFGSAGGAATEDVRRIFEVNALGPIGLVEASLAHLGPQGAVVGVSAIVADHPTAGVSHYSAAKAAFSAYLTALRRERRRDGLAVLDVRPPHMDTSFGDRPIFGRAPQLPEPLPVQVVVDAVMEAIRLDRREIAWDLKARSLVTA